MTEPAAPQPANASLLSLEERTTFAPRFDADGLIPCIALDATSGAILMFAWMNSESLRLTLETGFATYWSRSRKSLWKKGETSGALQRVVELRTDCDQDAIAIRVEVARPEDTCHTGRTTCFYRSVPLGPGPIEREFEPFA
ncbi:phosphoribosyl-AMP cyclohydrolase [Faunimonas pinastri]|uniref:Phosphoribosyl-AMP cyclohydrolase n=1 Tax=Faunimonas pinastri TaxID=1855383 RepID=A0A1H9DAU1_9HYPH|nr:phosphoribosyl-AMP cyclohydrolase [Faunimonas pinastri]SEQ10471.1 phosphoribosyl-AMP cyclohydrolase [Faunimonas pinastri]